jgi:hypothetical protein
MTRLLLMVVALVALNGLGCEGNTTGMYQHKPDHKDEAAKATQQGEQKSQP